MSLLADAAAMEQEALPQRRSVRIRAGRAPAKGCRNRRAKAAASRYNPNMYKEDTSQARTLLLSRVV